MKDVFQISFSVKVEASPLAKGIADPFVKVLNSAVPLLERVAEAAVKSFERNEDGKKPTSYGSESCGSEEKK